MRAMFNTLLVMLGGAIGAAMRYHVSRQAAGWFAAGWPGGTLLVNVAGGLAMGLLAGWLHRQGQSEPWRLLLGVGVLGGFTTFSAFSLESYNMILRGELLFAAAYAVSSVAGSILMLYCGVMLTRIFG